MIRKNAYLLLLLWALPLFTNAQLSFTENKGQWHEKVLFKTEAGSGAFFLSKDGYTILMKHPDDFLAAREYYHPHGKDSSHKSHTNQTENRPPARMRAHAYRVKFEGANFSEVVKEKPLPGYENYFIGDDPSKWATGCVQYQAVTYKNIYPGIDLRYYVLDNQLKYDLVIYPGADAARIKMRYEGAESIRVKNQELVIGTSVGEAKELRPYTFQFSNGKRELINCRYKVAGNTVAFDLGSYDKSTTLIIDPSLVFSVFSGSTTDNWGFTATPGPDGSLYGGGIAASTGFPVTAGVIQNTGGGGGGGAGDGPPDIGIMRLSPNGTTRIFSTYLGGDGVEQPHSLVADAQGNLVIAGRTNSRNFAVSGTVVGAISGYDIFVMKINATGTAIIGTTRICGRGNDGVNISPVRTTGTRSILRNYGDDGRSEVILDGNGNILLASCTQSDDFPVRGAFQATFNGSQDGVVLKLNANANTLIWSSYLGGSGDDAAFVLATNPLTGDIYVGGGTSSNNLPGAGGVQPANAGNEDGFLTRLRDNTNAVAMVTTTYVGTSGVDIVYGVKFDQKGFPYIMGTTTGTMPVVKAAYNVPNARQFIAKLLPDLSAYDYRVNFGSPGANFPNISPVAFLVDNCENVYVSGWGGVINTGANFNSSGTFGMPVTSDAFQRNTDGSDFYFFVLAKDGVSQLYGSFFGQIGGSGGAEHVDGGTSRFDEQGAIYQAICANCRSVPVQGQPSIVAPYPTTAGPFSVNRATSGGQCNLGMVKMNFNFSGVDVALNTTARQLNFCLPATVQFFDSVLLAKQYVWVWGDGTRSDTTTENPISHTYTSTGFFNVKVYGIDTSTCNEVDSATIRIRVTTDSAAISFDYARRTCNSLTFDFTNTSDKLTSIPNFGPRSFAWVWGDGTRNDTIAAFSPPLTHTFPGPGTYNVRLILIDTNFCNTGDSAALINFSVIDNVRAGFRVDDLCVPDTVNVTDTSLGAVTYLWVSSDGQTSTGNTPGFLYSTPGVYTIKQYVFNSNTCNLVDSTERTFTASALPVPGFIYNPNPSQENTPTRFVSTASSDVVRWLWDFGDGATSTQRDPIHQYIRPNPGNIVCQTVFNEAGCVDSVCIPVESIINIINELPSAFSPNGDGVNDLFFVRGFGISKLTLRVFNRQGLMVFESASQSVGWDGKYKGIPQPMDAYAWTLDLEYFNGEKVRKKGDLTLLR
jgi:gliding motility-associated-like protein